MNLSNAFEVVCYQRLFMVFILFKETVYAWQPTWRNCSCGNQFLRLVSFRIRHYWKYFKIFVVLKMYLLFTTRSFVKNWSYFDTETTDEYENSCWVLWCQKFHTFILLFLVYHLHSATLPIFILFFANFHIIFISSLFKGDWIMRVLVLIFHFNSQTILWLYKITFESDLKLN